MNKEKKFLKAHFVDVGILGSNIIFFTLGLLFMMIKSVCSYKMQIGLSIFVIVLFLLSMMTFMLLKKKILCMITLLSFIALSISYFYEIWVIYISVPVTLVISSIYKIIYFHKHQTEQFYRRINVFVFIPIQLIIAIAILFQLGR